jgi:prepilin-type N-terminal cleavage/methylation domain-containing protein
MHNRHSPIDSGSAFTLIELLVVIAIIAILSVVVVLTLNPAELLRQSRDASRVSDMATINGALGIYAEDTGGSMGSPNVVYVSIPDLLATSTSGDQCQGLGLISLPSLYSYHCAASSTYRNVDGTGWIPLNLTSISSGAPFGSFPVDPFNTSSSRLYYTYTTDGTQYEVTSAMESSKYKLGGSNDVISGDGGPLASVYEKGTQLGLEPLDYGDTSLVGYWTFDEDTGTVAYDYSGGNHAGTWKGTPAGNNGTYYTGGKVGSYAGYFDGSTNYVTTSYTPTSKLVTISAWIYDPGTKTSERHIAEYSPFQIYITGHTLFFYGGSGLTISASPSISTGTWHYVDFVGTSVGHFIYVDGALASDPNNTSPSGAPSSKLFIGEYYNSGLTWSGNIDDIRLYNRALSAAEIQAMYNSQK